MGDRTLFGASLATQGSENRSQQANFRPRAVILTALPVEYAAVRAHLGELREESHPQGTVYERGIFRTDAWVWDVGIVEIGPGNSAAAFEAERAIQRFQPQVVLFVGVAGGLKDVTLGDVVAATRIYGYESGKATETFLPRLDVGNTAYELEQRARAEARRTDWLQRIPSGTPEPAPRVLVGPIAAGEKVVASERSEVYRFLRMTYGDALAVEMEGGGFVRAAHANRQVMAMVIRGISDLIEGKAAADAGGSQERAAKHASAFAFELLTKLDSQTLGLDTLSIQGPQSVTAPPIGNADQLSELCAQQRQWRTADLVGIGRRFVPELYISRPEAYEMYRSFLRSDAKCFGIVGESGVGKTNLVIGLSELSSDSIEKIFYEGVQLKHGLASAFREDFPWAFDSSGDLDKAAGIVVQLFARFGRRLVVLVDALEDIPADARQEFATTVRRFAKSGIRSMVTCKDVVWPSFVLREGALTAFGELVYPPALEEGNNPAPGWRLGRCSRDELDAAWARYAEVFQLSGERSEEFNEEASLLYWLRLIGETYHHRLIPKSLSSLSLLDEFWRKKADKTGDAHGALVVIREVARALLREGITEIDESVVWPDVMDTGRRAAYESLCREHVLVVRSGPQARYVRFYHEKLQAYSVAILEGRWHQRDQWSDDQLVATWLKLGVDNQALVSAIEFFVDAFDFGEIELLSTLFRVDLHAFGSLVPRRASTRHRPGDVEEWQASDHERIVRRLVQRTRCFDILIHQHFPHLPARVLGDRDRQAGCVVRVFPGRVVWAYRPITDDCPGQVVRDEVNEVIAGGVWDQYGVSVLRSEGWSSLLEQLPQHLAFEDIKRELEDALRRTRRMHSSETTRLWERDAPALMHERAWHLLYQSKFHSPRQRNFGKRSEYLYQILSFANDAAARAAAISDIQERILYQMLWETTQDDLMIVKEETVRDNNISRVLMQPPDEVVTIEANRRWAEGGYSLSHYNHYGELPDALRELYECLEVIAPNQAQLDGPILAPVREKHQVWEMVPRDECAEYVRQLIPVLRDTYQAMARSNFPTLSTKFPLCRLSNVFTVAELWQGHGGLSVRYGFLEITEALHRRHGNSYVSTKRHMLNDQMLGEAELELQLGDVHYKGPGYLYHATSVGPLTLQDHVYSLLRQDINAALAGFQFHTF